MLLAIAWSALLHAQDKPPEKCSLSGTVVNSITGELLSKVSLALVPLGGASHLAFVTATDAEGRFSMVELEAGKYHLTAQRNGYLDTSYGAHRPEGDGAILRLEPGQSMADLKFKLIPFGVIAGVVRDSDGEPLNGAHVSVAQLTYTFGKPRWDAYEGTETDDLGQYRVRGLKPGKYYVGVKPDVERRAKVDSSKAKAATVVAVPTVYPGSADTTLAAPIEVAAGARVTGIDITLAKARTFTVSGRVVTVAGSGAMGTTVTFRSRDHGMVLDSEWSTTTRNANGDFEIRGVQAGHYNVSAMRSGEVSVTPLDLTGDIEGVRVVLGKGALVRATLAMDDGTPVKPERWQVLVTVDGQRGYFLEPENERVSGYSNVAPDRYDVRLERPGAGAYVKSISAGDTDILSEGLTLGQGASVQLEITLAKDAGKVEGAVTGQDDQPASGATVVLVPEARLRSRTDLFQSVTTDQFGHFEFATVPPGEYKVFAWDDVEPGIWHDPAFLKDFEKNGQPVTVASKGHETVKVKL